MTRVHGRHRLAARPGYEPLARVLDRALAQAQRGKGYKRHASHGEAFVDQPIIDFNERVGTVHGALFQVYKKALESDRLSPDHAVRELLGAINYAAAAVLVIQRRRRGTRAPRTRRRRRGAKR